MLAEAERQTPASVRELYAPAYAEMRGAGYTAVGEFHYLGLPEARAALAAAGDAGIEIVILLAAYARGGLPRMRQASVTEFLKQVEELRGDGARVGLAPTPCVRARATGSRRSAAMPRAKDCRCTSTPASNRARSRSALPSTVVARSSFSTVPAASART